MKWVEQDARLISRRLQGYLAQLAKECPNIWSWVDNMRAARGKTLPNWPNWCFLPSNGSYSLATLGRAKDLDPVAGMDLWTLDHKIAALVAWRPTQGIYRFHPEVFSALWDTPVDGDIPVELLYRLPEWCCYVDCYEQHTPDDYDPDLHLPGFFVHLECDGSGGHPHLNIVLDGGMYEDFAPYSLHISGGKNVADMFVEFFDELERTKRQTGGEIPENWVQEKALAVQRLSKSVKPLMSLVLYLCSTSSEIRDVRGTDKLPARAKPTKTKRGERIFAPDHPTIWETGYRIGRLIQQARADRNYSEGTGEGTHASPSPHIRKPHWHSFWKGPKEDPKKRELIAHWLPPIPVGYKPGDEIVPTIHPVK